MDEDGMNMEI